MQAHYNIYIPLWLDYNDEAHHCVSDSYQIYIPLWLDYNSEVFKEIAEYEQIYIPLWLDYNETRMESRTIQIIQFTFHFG